VASRSKALACRNFGFEYGRGHGRLSLVSVVCCQVEVSGTDRSLIQGSPTECVCNVLLRESGAAITLNTTMSRKKRSDSKELFCSKWVWPLGIWNGFKSICLISAIITGTSTQTALY